MKVSMLLVDDEAMLVQSLSARIRYLNNPMIGEIFTARGAKDALNILGREEIGIMIVDMIMPGMSGLDLLRAAADIGFQGQFIVLSGHDDYILIRESFKAGTVDYLLKPVSNNDLLISLRKAIQALEARLIREYSAQRNVANALLGALHGVPLPTWKNRIVGMVGHTVKFVGRVVCATCQESAYEKLLFMLLSHYGTRKWTYCSHRNCILVFVYGTEKDPPPLFLQSMLPANVTRFAQSRCVSTWEEGYNVIKDMNDIVSIPILFSKTFYSEYEPPHSSESLVSRDALHTLYNADAAQSHELIGGMVGKCLSEEQLRNASVDTLEAFLNQILNRLALIAPLQNRKSLEDFTAIEDLVGYLLQCNDEALAQSSQAEGRDVVTIALDYIAKHFGEDIDMRTLAQSLNINYTYFSELFKRQTGETFTTRLIRVRIEHAQLLLGNPALRMQDIGRQVGYDSAKHFARAFKKYIGKTPSEYRTHLVRKRRE